MSLEKRLFASELHLNNFRSFKDVIIPLGRKITVISGVNGVGKSNLISLIASGSGVSKKSMLGSNFQPEFADFFHIDVNESYKDYKIFIKYEEENGAYALTKRLSFKDDSKTNRGIRIIPRTAKELSNYENVTEAQKDVKNKYGVGGAGRVLIPTIYLSLSRLYPLGEQSGTVTVNKIKRNSPFAQDGIREKYREWYNYVIPGAITVDADYSVIKKQACSRASLHMDIEHTPTLSQSIGQDNVGNIISALVDIYRLSMEEGYSGAILCIDEIEVSLHPDTQVNLINLLDSLADQLKIQIIVSTHSLTVLKECLLKENKNENAYRVVYLKNPAAPYMTERKSYELLKADMLGSLQFNQIKVKMYFEDEIGKMIFEGLMRAYSHVLQKVKSSGEEKILRNAENSQRCTEINQRIKKNEEALSYRDNTQFIVTSMGCDTLIKVSAVDAYFKRIIFMLDGDARTATNKPLIRDYLDKVFNPREHGVTERKHGPNIIFAPGFFAPESYLFKIIRGIYEDVLNNAAFWRGMDAKEETALFTSDKIKTLFSGLQADFNNDNLKTIFGETGKGEVWEFINKSDILSYYYADYKTVPILLDFVESYIKAYDMAYPLTRSNRYC